MKKLGQSLFFFFFKVILGIYVFLFQHFRFRKNGYKLPKGPVLFLSNHHSDWDPIYLNVMFFSRNIRFLANDELFSNRFLDFIFRTCLGAVKRGSSKTDVSGVRSILALKKQHLNIGIYPEGDIHMFGRMINVNEAISKLALKLDMPIALLNLTGAHLRAPRWSHYPYRSRVTYHLNDIIRVDELQRMDLNALNERIWKGIASDEMAWQKKAMVRQWGFRRAEWLELGLFCCPNCGRFESLKSCGNDLSCTSCGTTYHFDGHSFFHFPKDYPGPRFQTTAEWDDWQLVALSDFIKSKSGGIIFTCPHLEFSRAEYGKFFSKNRSEDARLTIYSDHLEIVTGSGETNVVLSQIVKVQLQYKDTLEVDLSDIRFRFHQSGHRWSGYLYSQTIHALCAIHQSQTTT